MTPIYCTVQQLSDLFRIDYSTSLDILHQDVEKNATITKLNRYDLMEVVTLHKNFTDGPLVNLETTFLNLYEVQHVLTETVGAMVYSTVLRKAMKGEVPALKFGDVYRVPENVLLHYIKQGKVRYRIRKIRLTK